LLEWTTTQTFSGGESVKTTTFTTNKQWRISWKCNPYSNAFNEYNLIAYIYQVYPDGERNLIDVGINEICRDNNTSGTSDHYFDPGTYLLDITSDGTFVMYIQEHNISNQ
jgi:hypothetical protein